MKRVPYVTIILENMEGEVLLLLRDNQSTRICAKHWTLIGGKVEKGEAPELAAQRALEQETGLRVDVSFWKHYDRQHPLFTVDQYIFTGNAGDTRNLLILGSDAQFLRPSEVRHLNIGYGFDSLLEEYFLLHER